MNFTAPRALAPRAVVAAWRFLSLGFACLSKKKEKLKVRRFIPIFVIACSAARAQQVSVGAIQQNGANCVVGAANGPVYFDHVNCSDNRAAIEALVKAHSAQLRDKDQQIDQLQRSLNTSFQNYKDLVDSLAAVGQTEAQKRKTYDLLKSSKFDEARGLIDQILEAQEKQVYEAAEQHFFRGHLFELDARTQEALEQFQTAYRYRPDDPRFAIGYADALNASGRLPEAEKIYLAALNYYQSNSGANLPEQAHISGNLGVLYGRQSQRAANETERAQWEQRAVEALDKARQAFETLAARDPVKYTQDLAESWSNLGNAYLRFRTEKALEAFGNAQKIYADVPKTGSKSLLPDQAALWLGVGSAYMFAQPPRAADAEQAFNNARKIYADLRKDNPTAYRQDASKAELNLGLMYAINQKAPEAEAAFICAVAVLVTPDKAHPGDSGNCKVDVQDRLSLALAVDKDRAIMPDVASILSFLGSLYKSKGRTADAQPVCEEAKTLFGLLVIGGQDYTERMEHVCEYEVQ
jgi:hypothetical protein